jgi:hypothetical protein
MIGKLLGHTQVQTTARYAHLAGDPVKAAANDISHTIAGGLARGSRMAGSRHLRTLGSRTASAEGGRSSSCRRYVCLGPIKLQPVRFSTRSDGPWGALSCFNAPQDPRI